MIPKSLKMSGEVIYLLFFCFTSVLFYTVVGQLVVNVKNKGGDVLIESIEANTTADTVHLEFQNTDGTLITQFIDFKSEVQVFRVYDLWEEERGVMQSQPQVLCFVTRFGKTEFITSDAMSKLRQKNPTAIRTPEEEKAPENHVMDAQVDLEKAHLISPHLFNICQEAKESTFVKEGDIRTWSRSLEKDYNTLMSAVKRMPSSRYPRCKEVPEISKPCMCRYEMCVGWYPCGLKYCRGRDSTGKLVNYRCGIKTCKRCLIFDHTARQKMYCLWDDL